MFTGRVVWGVFERGALRRERMRTWDPDVHDGEGEERGAVRGVRARRRVPGGAVVRGAELRRSDSGCVLHVDEGEARGDTRLLCRWATFCARPDG